MYHRMEETAIGTNTCFANGIYTSTDPSFDQPANYSDNNKMGISVNRIVQLYRADSWRRMYHALESWWFRMSC